MSHIVTEKNCHTPSQKKSVTHCHSKKCHTFSQKKVSHIFTEKSVTKRHKEIAFAIWYWPNGASYVLTGNSFFFNWSRKCNSRWCCESFLRVLTKHSFKSGQGEKKWYFCCCQKQVESLIKMSDSDEILFDDIYELHEVIGEIIDVVAIFVVVFVKLFSLLLLIWIRCFPC